MYKGQATLERASGEAPQPSQVEESLLESILEAVEDFLEEENRQLQPAKKAQLVAALYDMFSESEEKKVNKAVIIRLTKLAA